MLEEVAVVVAVAIERAVPESAVLEFPYFLVPSLVINLRAVPRTLLKYGFTGSLLDQLSTRYGGGGKYLLDFLLWGELILMILSQSWTVVVCIEVLLIGQVDFFQELHARLEDSTVLGLIWRRACSLSFFSRRCKAFLLWSDIPRVE